MVHRSGPGKAYAVPYTFTTRNRDTLDMCRVVARFESESPEGELQPLVRTWSRHCCVGANAARWQMYGAKMQSFELGVIQPRWGLRGVTRAHLG